AGSYTVNISDAQGCSLGTALQVTITQPSSDLNATASSSNVTCFGGSNGSITIVNASGGSSIYEYSINGGTTWQSSALFNNLPAAGYNLHVRDAAGTSCVFIINAALVINQPGALSATATSSNTSCFGSSDGTISVANMSGGSGTYEYSINNGSSWQGSSSFRGLIAGSYTVQVRDLINPACVFSIPGNLSIIQPALLSATVEAVNVSCRGANNGSIRVVNSTGGYGNFQFSINGGVSWQTLQVFNNLGPGIYNVQIRDALNPTCVQTLNSSVTIREAAEPLVSAITSQMNINCFGASTGSVLLFVRGGVAPYSYAWSNGSTSRDLTDVPAGIYTVNITDSYNCVSTQTISITQPVSTLNVSFSKKDVSCFGANNGSINISSAGGTAPYTYRWNDGRVTKDITNLTTALYTITVVDSKGCSISQEIRIDQPALTLSLELTKINVSCFGGGDGSVRSKVTGGTAPYTYNWSNGQKTSDVSGLPPGNYNVTIFDASGCTINQILTITQPAAALKASLTIKNTLCKTSSDGSITAIISGGTSPYKISWKGNAGTTNGISNLAAGIYDLTLTDANGCMLTVPAEVKAGICPPVAIDDQFKTYQDESLTGSAAPNDFDRENEPLSFSLALQPKNGKILFKADGTFTYTPNAGFWGIEIIPYRICNTSGVCSSAAIAIDVIPFTIVNLTPSISNVNEGRKISVTARLVKPYPEDVVIKLSYSGIAVKDLDYVLLDQFLQIIIPKGKLTTTQKITIAALTDNLQEGNEVLNIQIAATSHPEVRIGSGAMVIIGDIYPPAPIDPVESKEVPVNTDLKIDPLFSPNGDGQGNETFTIDNIVSFPDNEVVIFNRWGNEVFRIKGYNQSDRVFKGYANTGLLTNTNTPIVDGVYYYLITTRRTVNGEVVTALNKGYLILKR
ncbi:MAG: gliding motility-associated C-terminal domain-containing protein, partial [Daejeonella sp.]